VSAARAAQIATRSAGEVEYLNRAITVVEW